MHSDEREMLRGSLRRVLTETDPVKLPAALDEFGWPDLLASDPAEAVPALFETQGETVTASPALNAVMAGPLLAAGRLDAGGARAGVGEWTVVLPGPGSGSGRAGPVLAVAAGAAVTRCLLVGQHDGHTTLAVVDTADGGRGGGPVESVDGVDPWLGLVRIVDRRSPPVRVAARGDAVSTAWAESVAAGRRALAHELCGLGRAMLALAVDHARERRQFGRPIGTFQAVKHRLADAKVALTAAEAAAGEAWADPGPLTALLAKLWAGRAARLTGKQAQQVLGGMGFTWEHPFHRHVRRALVLDSLLGSTTELTNELGRTLLLTGEVPQLARL
ncbi:MAG TPA: acyl-CoA dehydrogenase family protein [Acidimicrobiia bacterium]|nr:acyl-CoA dehydrogenase family protein [Acidimicrobiia bacterium]